MTVKQFRKKVEVARKYGKANLGESTLYYHKSNAFGHGYWSIVRDDGNTVTVADNPKQMEYLFD